MSERTEGISPTYTAIIQYHSPWWIGWVAEIPGVNAQERQREDLMASLRSALSDVLETNRELALAICQEPFELTPVFP